jgi:hypothetical protein
VFKLDGLAGVRTGKGQAAVEPDFHAESLRKIFPVR